VNKNHEELKKLIKDLFSEDQYHEYLLEVQIYNTDIASVGRKSQTMSSVEEPDRLRLVFCDGCGVPPIDCGVLDDSGNKYTKNWLKDLLKGKNFFP
jgi:hypothetical protein